MLKIDSWALNGLDSHVAGKLLLARIYEELTGEEMPEILKAPRGKPYFDRSPLHFSITHTKTHVFCALSDVSVGIDAEDKNRNVSPSLAEKILSPGEYAQYQALPAKNRNDALLRFWVLKEAEVKCSGLGLRGYPNHTDFKLDDPRIREMEGCYVAVIQSEVTDLLAKEEEDAL